MAIEARSGHSFARRLCAAGTLPLLVGLGACAAGARPGAAVTSAAAPPTYHVGDSLTYDENGREETIFVTAVDGDQISWTDNENAHWTGSRDPVIPPRIETSRPGGDSILRLFAPEKPTIFPLEPGKRIEYSVTISGTGRAAPRRVRESCEVNAPRPITVEAGTYRAWEIMCQRAGYRETLYYAPAIGAIVLKRRESEARVQLETLADYHKAEPVQAADGGLPSTREGASSARPSAVREAPDQRSLGQESSGPTAARAGGGAASRHSATADTAGSAASAKVPEAQMQRPPLAPAFHDIIPDSFPAAPRPAPAPTEPWSRPVHARHAASERSARTAAARAPADGARYVVQLAAYRSPEAADQNWHGMAQRLPRLLHDFSPQFENITARGTRYVRLLVGPFGNEKEAQQLCGQLRAAGQDCWVRPTP